MKPTKTLNLLNLAQALASLDATRARIDPFYELRAWRLASARRYVRPGLTPTMRPASK